jgi:hypothetical protein
VLAYSHAEKGGDICVSWIAPRENVVGKQTGHGEKGGGASDGSKKPSGFPSKIEVALSGPVAVRHEETAAEKGRYTEEEGYRRKQLTTANRLNWITGIAAVAAILSVLGLICSLYQSRRSLEIDQRAWVGVKGVHLNVPYSAQHLGITVDLANSGKTPAQINSIHVTVVSSDKPDTLIFEKHLGEGMTVAPTATSPLSINESSPISDATFERLQAHQVQHLFRGVVTYRDIWNNPGKTDFCIVLSGTQEDLSPGNPFPRCEPNIMK